jgi:hypothetical protein
LSALDAFSAAVERFELVEPPLEWSPEAEEAARRSVEETGLLLFGEVHGVVEVPGLILALARRLGLRGLALEWSPGLRPLVERFLATGELSLDGLEPLTVEQLCCGDGRVTAGHFALLRALRPAPLLLFSGATGPTDWSGRDLVMARLFLREWDGETPTLLAAGRLHTELADHRHGRPLGVHLAAARPGVAAVRLECRSGTFTNLGVRRIPGLPGRGPARLAREAGGLVLELPRATAATVPALSDA